MVNKILKETILSVVDNQLDSNDPPMVKECYQRLLKSGHSKENARILIGQALAEEMRHVMHNNEVYNEERYKKLLEALK